MDDTPLFDPVAMLRQMREAKTFASFRHPGEGPGESNTHVKSTVSDHIRQFRQFRHPAPSKTGFEPGEEQTSPGAKAAKVAKVSTGLEPATEREEEKKNNIISSLFSSLAGEGAGAESTPAKVAKVAKSDHKLLRNNAFPPLAFAAKVGEPGRKLQSEDGAFEEQATILEYEAGLTRAEAEARALSGLGSAGPQDAVLAWLDAFERLSVASDPCPGFRPGDWPKVRSAALAFLDDFGEQAAALGWGTLDLFGVHPAVGVVRVDCAGALMLTGRSHVVAITADTIRYSNGQAYRRVSAGPAVAVWDFASGRPALASRVG